MNNKKITRLVFVFFIPMLLMLLTSCAIIPHEVKNMENGKEGIVKIANETAKKMGYNLSDVTVVIDKDNSAWNNHISKGALVNSEYGQDVEKKLHDRKYWAVYYQPKRTQFGGDLFVFIDKETKKVITVLRGQ